MSRKGSADYRARERVGLKPLKLLVDREQTIAMLEHDGVLRRPVGAFAGYEYSWAEVERAAALYWNSLVLGPPEEGA